MLLVAAGLAACGNKGEKEGHPVVIAHNEGIYLEIGELTYQVQISRQLNPFGTQDRFYLRGMTAQQAALKPDEVWFGVFMRVQNESDKVLLPSNNLEIHDTQDVVYKPITPNVTNDFIYRSVIPLKPGDILPFDDTPAYTTPIQGQLLLFKLPLEALGNRPLELRVVSRGAPRKTGIFELDV